MLLAAASLAFSQAAGAETCIADWGTAGEIVRREQLVSVEQIARRVKADGLGQILQTTLCRNGGGYVYRLVVRDGAGQLKNAIISAKGQGTIASQR